MQMSIQRLDPADRDRASLRDPSLHEVTTPTTGGVSDNYLKLASEEYRVCSTRVDELARLVWQSFLGVMAIAVAIAAGTVRHEQGRTALPSLVVSLLPYWVVFALGLWSRIAEKWQLQQKALYARLDDLEAILRFRTNAQFERVDVELNRRGQRPVYISRIRRSMVHSLVGWWGLVALINSLEYKSDLEGIFGHPSVPWVVSVFSALLVGVIFLGAAGKLPTVPDQRVSDDASG